MARMQLKYCDVEIRDGLSGTAAVDQDTTAPAEGDTTLTIDTIALNTSNTELVPISKAINFPTTAILGKHETVGGCSISTRRVRFENPF